jgi:hypothetical protein
VRGEDDRSLAPRLVADEAGQLSAAGIGYRTIVYPGGHDIDAGTLMDLGEA